mmetsp:Transcript_30719/g.73132  ORF Transcript_30719/g.73132 Transcript_30719/m.73132 type:complete len:1027 (-) Transcript_30719:155-3235(-)
MPEDSVQNTSFSGQFSDTGLNVQSSADTYLLDKQHVGLEPQSTMQNSCQQTSPLSALQTLSATDLQSVFSAQSEGALAAAGSTGPEQPAKAQPHSGHGHSPGPGAAAEPPTGTSGFRPPSLRLKLRVASASDSAGESGGCARAEPHQAPQQGRHDGPHPLKGRQIVKEFDGVPYKGVIDGYDPEMRWFHVTYEDGDQEELGPIQIQRLLTGYAREGSKRATKVLARPREESLICRDIAHGKEPFTRIPVYNEVSDDAKLPRFSYITQPLVRDTVKAAIQKAASAGEHRFFMPFEEAPAYSCPYDKSLLLQESNPFGIREVDSRRKVVSKGLKLPLEVFMTGSKGWGVRCSRKIPSGSFVCEYVGEVISHEEANLLKGKDQYLFDLDHFQNLYNCVIERSEGKAGTHLHPALKESFEHRCQASMRPDEPERNLVLNAHRFGNVGRFINHADEGNCLLQPVFTSLDRKNGHSTLFYKMCIFACEDIEPFTELTYNYGYHGVKPSWLESDYGASNLRGSQPRAERSDTLLLRPPLDPSVDVEWGCQYRGVSYQAGQEKPWSATVQGRDRKPHHCGFFATAEEAARAHDREAVLQAGPSATTNFPTKRYSRELEQFWRRAKAEGAAAPPPADTAAAAAAAGGRKRPRSEGEGEGEGMPPDRRNGAAAAAGGSCSARRSFGFGLGKGFVPSYDPMLVRSTIQDHLYARAGPGAPEAEPKAGEGKPQNRKYDWDPDWRRRPEPLHIPERRFADSPASAPEARHAEPSMPCNSATKNCIMLRHIEVLTSGRGYQILIKDARDPSGDRLLPTCFSSLEKAVKAVDRKLSRIGRRSSEGSVRKNGTVQDSPAAAAPPPAAAARIGLHWGHAVPNSFDGGSICAREIIVQCAGGMERRRAIVSRYDHQARRYELSFGPNCEEWAELWNERVEWLPSGPAADAMQHEVLPKSPGRPSVGWAPQWDAPRGAPKPGAPAARVRGSVEISGQVTGSLMAMVRTGRHEGAWHLELVFRVEYTDKTEEVLTQDEIQDILVGS